MDKRKLIVYNNICKASLEMTGKFQQAPVFFLDEYQQLSLFNERQRTAMLILPLKENLSLQESINRYKPTKNKLKRRID